MNNFTQNVFTTSKNSFKNFVAICTFLLVSGLSFGQSNPTAHNLSSSSFTFTGFGAGTTTTYPTSMQGHKFPAERTTATLTADADGDRVLANNASSNTTGSIRNEVANGISLLNSGSNNIGAILVALNSTGRESLTVTFTAEQLTSGGNSATDRINGMRLQYRVGSTGTFTDVAATEYLTTITTALNAPQTFTSISLPSACNNQSLVHLRWVYYISSGTANGRDRIRLDDITVSSTAIPTILAPTVTTTTASNITNATADSGGNVTSDGGAALTAKGVAFGTSTNPTSGTSNGTATGTFTSNLSGLSPNTQYYYRAYATNSVGTSYGTESSFYTLANVPGVVTVGSPQVTTLNVTVNSTTENSNPASTVYALHETTTNQFIQADGTLGATAVWQTAATWSTITVTGLTQNTTYTFEAKAINQASVETTYGTTASGTTLANQTTDWCNLQSPTSQAITEGASFNVYSQAYKNGLTEAAGQASGLSAWIGYSSTNSNPNGLGWTWVNASFNNQIGNNDEFVGSIGTGLTPGTYYYASRFQIGSGSYTYGGTGGIWNNDNAVLTVNADLVDYCNASPSGANIVSEGTVYSLYSEVYEPGITPGAGQGSGITAYIGYSSTNDNPSSAGWTWIAATYQNEAGNNDVYKIDLPTNLALGNYYFASRYLKSTSSTYQYGGTTGNWNNNNGTFTVVSNVVDYCNVAPSGTNNSEEGNVFALYSDVYELGVTPGAGQGSGITAWIGYSSTNNDPSVSSGWTWIAATYNSESGNNDVYRVDLPSNLALGTYYFASRYQKTGSSEFRYGGTNGFWNNDNGVLNVVSNLVDYCNIQFPFSGNITQGDVYTVYAQVYEPGVTPGAGQGTGITAQIGYSTTNSTPDNTWTWLTPTYHATVTGNNDEYMVDLASGLAPGTYYYASRFQKAGSTQYQYGGTNGVWNNDNGVLVVNQAIPVVTSASPSGTVNIPFTYTISATNSPTAYAVVSGTLPAGLSLNTTSGLISGTPSTAGSFSVDVTATNSGGTSAVATLNFTIAQGSQTITFGALTPVTYGVSPYALSATASSGLTVTYASSNTAVATISGNTITVVGAGTTTITASQVGDSNYLAASDVNQLLTVNQKALTITGVTANNKVQDGTTTATLSGAPSLNGVELVDVGNVTISGTPTANFASALPGTGIIVTVTGYSLTGTASGNYAVSQPTGLTADITGLIAPVAIDETGVLETSFNANWNAVSGATSYELDVATTNTFSVTNTIYNETFESGNLSNWSNTTNFTNSTSVPITGTNSMRLNAPSSQSTVYTYTQPSSYDVTTGTTTWRFNIKTNYSPSTNNKAFFYLMSNQSNLTLGNGYVVGFNFVGSDDLIKLWKSTSGVGETTPLIASSQSVASGTVYGIEVTRTKEGVWSLKTKSGGGFTSMTSAASTATDVTYTNSTYSGLVSFSSSSNNTNLRFDDFSIDKEVPSTLPSYTALNVGNVTSYNVTGLTSCTQYYYRVRAVNGSVVSANSNTITVDPISIGGSVLGNQAICYNEQPATLTLSGHCGAIVKWQKATDALFTSPIDIASTSSTISGAIIGNLTDTTYFRAVVQSAANPVVYSAYVTVTVQPIATITTQPQPQTVCEGSSTTFTVALTGSTNYSYEWKKDGVMINGAPDLPTYTIATTSIADAGNYSVDVFDDCLNLISSNNAVLTVTPLVTPAFTQVAPICNGDALSSLPTTSNNGIVGTWSPAINNTATTTYTFTPDSGQCSPTVTMTIVVGGITTWTITSPATSPAWDNGEPTSITRAIIASNYSEVANIDACTLTVNNNAVVTIPSGSNVTLNGALTVATGSSFTLNNNSNLVQTSDVANSGNITVRRTTNPLMRFDYVMWSSPVDGTQSLLNFSPQTSISPTVRFYTYNSSNDQYVSVASPSTTEFQNATGYLIRLPFNHPTAPAVWNGSFVGQPNNGPISLGSLTSGLYYATGNPYPSTINADSFITTNNLDDALYFWRKTNGATGSAYATYTLAGGTNPTPGTTASPTSALPNGTIQVGQGFITKATSSSFEFNNQMRISNNANQTFRSASSTLSTDVVERNRIWLNLSNATATIGQTMVSYMTGATNGVDAQIDGKYINDSQTALTSIIAGQEFAIQGKTLPFEVTDVVPLGFKSETSGNFSISLYDKDGLFANTSQEIFLRDNQTSTVHNLNTGAYAFNSDVGTFNNRFEVIYQNTLGVDNQVLNPNNVIIYNSNNIITINTGIFDMASVKVFDIRGRLLAEKKNINATQTTLDVDQTNQILLVQVTSNEGVVVTKKVAN